MVDERVEPTERAGPLPAAAEWSRAAEAGASRTGASRRSAADAGAPAGLLGRALGLEARLPASILQAIIDAAREGYPNEACGILAGDAAAAAGGRPHRFHPLTNAAQSPYRYLIDPEEQLRAMLAMDDAGEVVWGVFHSHVSSPAEPSVTDIGLATYPDSLYLICSLGGEVPVVRAWSIREDSVLEVPIEVVQG